MKPDFNKAYDKLVSVEGLISNNPIDKGGFTYKGISSIEHPDWPGWQIVKDSIGNSLSFISRGIKACPSSGIGEGLNNNQQLNQLVLEFYRTEYWHKILGDHLQSR